MPYRRLCLIFCGWIGRGTLCEKSRKYAKRKIAKIRETLPIFAKVLTRLRPASKATTVARNYAEDDEVLITVEELRMRG